MIQEEASKKTVALCFRCVKLSADVLKEVMRKYLERRRDWARNNARHGKVTVRKLMAMDQGANTMEINSGRIKDFERVAKKYNVDFAVKKDSSGKPPKYYVFFKGRDLDVVSMAFREFVGMGDRKGKQSVIKKIRNLGKNRENQQEPQLGKKDREKKLDRGQER